MVSQLGLVPLDCGLDALEVSAAGARGGAAKGLAALGLPVVASSDSHSIDEIGDGRTWLAVEAPTFAELSLALSGREGRSMYLA